MIITRIKAGLGNQLFQYACGRAIALRNGDILMLDIQEWANHKHPPDPYGLGHFNIEENIASDKQITELRYPHRNYSRLHEKIRTKIGLFNVGYVPRVMKRKGDCYLDGYWQTEKYFLDKSDFIRKEFTLKNTMTEESRDVLHKILSEKISVSLHVRKGQIAEMGMKHTFYGISTNEYFSRAVDHIANMIGCEFHLFVFSDDIDIAKKEMIIKKYPVTFVSSPAIPDYEELILMSRCQHNIIANSTFSWWGAWLNQNPNKIIIAPKLWTRKGNYVFRNIIPKSWIRI